VSGYFSLSVLGNLQLLSLEIGLTSDDIGDRFPQPQKYPMATAIPSLHPTRAKVRLSAFRHNLNVVRRYVGKDVQIMAVVKSNAYGHGMRTIAYEAIRNGAEYLAVARIDEGAELRRDGIHHPLLVFEVPMPSQIERALLDNLELTVTTLESAQQISLAAQQLKKRAKVHVKVDTGMGRLGFPYHNALENIERIVHTGSIDVVGVYSHFATSDEPDLTYARVQLERFKTVLAQAQTKRIEIPFQHIANSGAILSLPESYFNIVRPGIMLYGYAPRNGMIATPALQPVMSLVSRVSQIKEVEPNTSISYNRRYFTKSRTRIATIPIGYGDGYSRALTNNAEVLIKGKRYAIVGTVCMDHIMVDVGMADAIDIGDDVTLIGNDGKESISAWDIAEKLGTIPYEVTCNISSRVQRAFTT
jgi:alanine racemase